MFVLLECCEIDERSSLLYDEANGEGESYLSYVVCLHTVDLKFWNDMSRIIQPEKSVVTFDQSCATAKACLTYAMRIASTLDIVYVVTQDLCE